MNFNPKFLQDYVDARLQSLENSFNRSSNVEFTKQLLSGMEELRLVSKEISKQKNNTIM